MIAILILPAGLILCFIFFLPILRYIWLSFHASSVFTGFVPLPNQGANWIRLINDNRFWQDAYQTCRFAFVSVTLELILALIIAILLDQRIRSRGAIRSISLLPWALPTTVMALGWRWIFNTPYGPIEQIIKMLGYSPINILSNPDLTWIATVISDVWKTTPFVALILLAGLQSISKDLYEAFKLDGGTDYQALTNITIPLLRPYILISLIFRLAQAFGVFDLIQIMTAGGPASTTESLAYYAYLNAMRFLDFGYSSTVMIASFIILITTCIISYNIYQKIMRIRLDYKS